MKYILRSSILIILLTSFFSCENEIENPGDDILMLDFMPIEIGKYWIYQVDSIVYDFGGSIRDTSSSFIREEIIDNYIDDTGATLYTIERTYKNELSDPWTFSDAWSCQKDSSQFIKTEENIKFLKLVFPPNRGVQWNGNVFFNEDIIIKVAGESLQPYRYWDYEIEEIGLDMTIAGESYTNVMRVNQVKLIEDSYEWRLGYEHYAKGVGLIQKTLEVLDAQCEPNCIGTFYDWAEKGFRLEQQLIEHN